MSLLHVVWVVGYLDLARALYRQPQLLWVHKCNSLSCPENSVSQHSSLISGSYNLSKMFPESWGKRVWNWCPIYSWAQLFSGLWPVMVSVLTTIHCRGKPLRWWLGVALFHGYKNKPLEGSLQSQREEAIVLSYTELESSLTYHALLLKAFCSLSDCNPDSLFWTNWLLMSLVTPAPGLSPPPRWPCLLPACYSQS